MNSARRVFLKQSVLFSLAAAGDSLLNAEKRAPVFAA